MKSALTYMGCRKNCFVLFLVGTMMATSLFGEETLPRLKNGKVPQTLEEMWVGFDPQKEPLNVQVLKDWEQDGVVLKVLRFRVGIFKKTSRASSYSWRRWNRRRKTSVGQRERRLCYDLHRLGRAYPFFQVQGYQ